MEQNRNTGKQNTFGEENTLAVAGRNAVLELLRSGRSVDHIYLRSGPPEGSLRVITAEAAKRGIPMSEVPQSRLDALSGGVAHQGVVALAAGIQYVTVEDLLAAASEKGEAPFLVVADGVEDPYNLGAIIRTAECAGAHGVIIPKHRAVGMTGAVMKSSAGAAAHLPVARVTNLAATVEMLKENGVWIYAAEAGGVPCRQADLRGGVALILGSEGKGVSQLLRKRCDSMISIPMYGRINPMNVSAAAAVLLCEIAAQRHAEKN